MGLLGVVPDPELAHNRRGQCLASRLMIGYKIQQQSQPPSLLHSQITQDYKNFLKYCLLQDIQELKKLKFMLLSVYMNSDISRWTYLSLSWFLIFPFDIFKVCIWRKMRFRFPEKDKRTNFLKDKLLTSISLSKPFYLHSCSGAVMRVNGKGFPVRIFLLIPSNVSESSDLKAVTNQ